MLDASDAGMSNHDFRAGHIIGGRYKIESVLGRGGMGVVYLAEDTVFQRQVAIKVLAHDRQSEEHWQRFKAEGKAIARLDHPNIVKVYDMGTDGPDCLYYVMDLLRGMSLAEMLRKEGCQSGRITGNFRATLFRPGICAQTRSYSPRHKAFQYFSLPCCRQQYPPGQNHRLRSGEAGR